MRGDELSPLLSPDETYTRVLGPVLGSVVQHKHSPKQVLLRATNMTKGHELLVYKEKLSKLGLFSLEKRRPKEDLMIRIAA